MKSDLLRILVAANVPKDPNSGAAGTVVQTNDALRRLGHVVDEVWAMDIGRKIRHGNLHYLLELPFAYRRILRSKLSTNKYDVIEFNQPHAYLASRDFSRKHEHGIFINRSHGHEVRVHRELKKWKVTLHGNGTKWIRTLVTPILQSLLFRHWEQISKTADGFHFSCTQDAEFQELEYGVDRDRICVIPQGVANKFLLEPISFTDSKRVNRLLYVGQFAYVKAPHLLAKVISNVLKQHSNATLTWVCSASHHGEAFNLLEQQVRSRVRFYDWIPQDELVEVFDSHSIFVFPSYFEGFGKAPLEAMSRGMCVVCSNTGGMRDYISHGKNGYLADVADSEGFISKLDYLLNNPQIVACVGRAARAHAAKYSWEACASKAVDFYHRLLSGKAGQRH